MTPVTINTIVEAFATELAGVVGALAEVAVTLETATARPEGGYRITMVADEGGQGVLYAQIGRDAAMELARLALGAGDDFPESKVLDGLRDMCSQALASVIERQKMDGVRGVVQSIDAIAEPADPSATLKGLVTPGNASTACVALWGTLVLGLVAQEPAAPTPPVAPPSHRPEPSRASAGAGPNLEAILDLELPLIVRFGRAELTLKDLAMLAPGAVIDLGRSPDDPVEVLVSNQVVARGEVVTVNGNYGVRITDVIGAADRIRHMEIAS